MTIAKIVWEASAAIAAKNHRIVPNLHPMAIDYRCKERRTTLAADTLPVLMPFQLVYTAAETLRIVR